MHEKVSQASQHELGCKTSYLGFEKDFAADYLFSSILLQINEITLMLYQKMDENNALTRRVEQSNTQYQQLFLQQQLASLQHVSGHQASTSPSLSAATATATSNLLNQVNLSGLLGAPNGQNQQSMVSKLSGSAIENLGSAPNGHNKNNQINSLLSTIQGLFNKSQHSTPYLLP